MEKGEKNNKDTERERRIRLKGGGRKAEKRSSCRCLEKTQLATPRGSRQIALCFVSCDLLWAGFLSQSCTSVLHLLHQWLAVFIFIVARKRERGGGGFNSPGLAPKPRLFWDWWPGNRFLVPVLLFLISFLSSRTVEKEKESQARDLPKTKWHNPCFARNLKLLLQSRKKMGFVFCRRRRRRPYRIGEEEKERERRKEKKTWKKQKLS